MPKDKQIVIGLVTTKTGEMETADEIKRRIDEAARYLPLDQLALSPQCGFSSIVLGNNITVEAEIAKLALVVRVAGEVWGWVLSPVFFLLHAPHAIPRHSRLVHG